MEEYHSLLKQYIEKFNPEKTLIKKELYSKIEEFINSLNDNADREIAFLKFYENMKYKNISNIVGIPIGTVKSKISSFKKTLKKLLKEYI